jgi:hypothetical protein
VRHSLVAFVVSIGLTACKDTAGPLAPIADDVSAYAHSQVPEPPRFRADVPVYPAPVLYILYREYLHRHPEVDFLTPDDRRYQAYVERRLRALYPDRGYDGMMADAARAHATYMQEWIAYERAQRAHDHALRAVDFGVSSLSDADPSWDGQEEHPPYPDGYIPTITMEIDSLVATGPEVDRIYYYESLADGSYYAQEPGGGDEPIHMTGGHTVTSIDDLIILAGMGITPLDEGVQAQWGPALVAAGVAIGLAGYLYWRIESSGDRARDAAVEHFPHHNQHNTRADAFRHVYVSVLLRRYITAPLALLVTNRYEEMVVNPYPEFRMDIHNNRLGRVEKYAHFRGNWLTDRWNWRKWGRTARDYINTPNYGEFIPEWNTIPPPPQAEVDARLADIPAWKYIFISNEMTSASPGEGDGGGGGIGGPGDNYMTWATPARELRSATFFAGVAAIIRNSQHRELHLRIG